jgi:hypothetical protein
MASAKMVSVGMRGFLEAFVAACLEGCETAQCLGCQREG